MLCVPFDLMSSLQQAKFTDKFPLRAQKKRVEKKILLLHDHIRTHLQLCKCSRCKHTHKRAKTHLKWLSAALGITVASQLFLSAGLSPCILSERHELDAWSDTGIIRHLPSKGHCDTMLCNRAKGLKSNHDSHTTHI